MARRANHALMNLGEHLGPTEDTLSVGWADFVGDESSELTFDVPTDDADDAYIQLQAYDVGEYGHEILVNGTTLTGFDIPPRDGWQTWLDAVTGASLDEGENTLRIRRDETTVDAFVVGAVAVNWTEPSGSV